MTTHQRSEVAPAPRRIQRFTGGQRAAHAATAVFMLACLATAAALYVDPISVAVGHRALVRTIHLWAGYLLPVPIIVALLLSRAMRVDARRVDAFTTADKEWLRARDRRSGRIRVGKFNAGQKLNASITTGAVLVMLLTGSVTIDLVRGVAVARPHRCHVRPRLGRARDLLLVAGHLWYALRDTKRCAGSPRGRSARTGRVVTTPDWLAEIERDADQGSPEPRTEVGLALSRQARGLARRAEGEMFMRDFVRTSCVHSLGSLDVAGHACQGRADVLSQLSRRSVQDEWPLVIRYVGHARGIGPLPSCSDGHGRLLWGLSKISEKQDVAPKKQTSSRQVGGARSVGTPDPADD